MKVTFTNLKWINLCETLEQFMQLEFPIDISWNLKRNMKKIQSALQLIGECEDELIVKYAVKDDNGNIKLDANNQPEIVPDKLIEYNKEHIQLLKCENTIDIFPIKASELKDYCKRKDKDIKPSLLYDLDFMIEDDFDNQESTEV